MNIGTQQAKTLFQALFNVLFRTLYNMLVPNAAQHVVYDAAHPSTPFSRSYHDGRKHTMKMEA
jgi:hypothetical protein